MFKPNNPPIVPTPDAFMDSIVATRSEMIFCYPSYVEAWACDEDHLTKLKSLRMVVRHLFISVIFNFSANDTDILRRPDQPSAGRSPRCGRSEVHSALWNVGHLVHWRFAGDTEPTFCFSERRLAHSPARCRTPPNWTFQTGSTSASRRISTCGWYRRRACRESSSPSSLYVPSAYNFVPCS